jgi:RNA polymerase sigma factor (sigma-70 family)
MVEMHEKSDVQLLRDYAEDGHEAAFRELVTRHADFVFSAALRQVNSPDLAGDIAQGVFTDLAHKARTLAEQMPGSLAGWLHRSTRYAALNHLRDTRRRLANERQAMEQLLINSESAPDWERIRPVLDEALDSLGDEDREALLLRYFKNQDFRAVGLALGVSDDTAQKRVSRAVERLREFFSKRNVTIGASGLVVLISANAIQAAPVGLAATISAAAILAGTAVHTSTIIAATKTIAMTTLQKTFIAATLTAAIGTGIFEAHQASQLRDQVQTLQKQQAPLTEQNQQLQRERDDATNRVAGLNDELAKANRNNSELLKLRSEITMLKRNPANQKPADVSASPTETVKSPEPSSADVGRELGAAVVRGDAGAFDKLLAESITEHESFRTNIIGLDKQQQYELSMRAFAPINAAFKVIAEAADNGSQPALDALTRSLQISALNGLAVNSLGGLAGKGDTGALEVLIHPEKYGALLSSTIPPLRSAADNGNQTAIDALAAVAADPKNQPLWPMTANSLAKAAAAGNTVATDALISMSSSTNQIIQSAIIEVLRTAASNQNAKAAEALRSMGIQ